MATRSNTLLVASNENRIHQDLEDVFGKDTINSSIYPMSSCGNLWLLNNFPHSSLTVFERLDEHFESLEGKESQKESEGSSFDRPTFVVFNVKSKVHGYYYVSLWDKLKEGDSVE